MAWAVYAILSAFFASLVAIFGKIGIQGVNSNVAVAIRTVIIVLFAWTIVFLQGNASTIRTIPDTHGFLLFCLPLLPVFPGCFITGHCNWAKRAVWLLLISYL